MRTTRNIFLAGGGSEQDSASLDAAFATQLSGRPLLYLPHAMARYRFASARHWLQAVFEPLGATVHVPRGLEERGLNPSAFSGIYLGGGDTGRLLRVMYATRLAATVRRAISMGLPVYGGSAGAIVLGGDIRTAPEARNLHKRQARGLELLDGWSVVCHYKDDQHNEVANLARRLHVPIIALAEQAGVRISGHQLTVFGTVEVALFSPNGSVKTIAPGKTRVLSGTQSSNTG